MTIDLNSYTFDEWVTFVFDHPVSKPDWWFAEEWECDATPEVVLRNTTQLFEDPAFLLSRYSVEQIEQGFWCLLGPGNFSYWLWDEEISWPLRHECIRSMVVLFEKLFANAPLGEMCFMWWDLVRNFEDRPDQRVTEAMGEALTKVLRFDSRDCQKSALHGLSHLGHPRRKQIIGEFLANHPEVDEDLKAYALAAEDGKVL